MNEIIGYQMNTSNKSFIEMHRYLQSQGIENNRFMLELVNEALATIDPWDPELSQVEVGAIITECSMNFWYFIREILKWRMAGGELIPVTLERGNMAMFYNSLARISNWRTNIRQSCSDLSVQSFLLYQMLFNTNGDHIIQSKDVDGAKESLRRIADLKDCIPPRIASGLTQAFAHNQENIRNVLTHSQIKILPGPISISHAQNSARGNTSEICFFHLPEFYKTGLKELIENRSVILSIGDGRERFNIFNSPYCEIGSETVAYAMDYIESMIKWQDRFYDYDIEEIKTTLRRFSNNVIYIKHYYDEIGKTEEWFADHCKMMGATRDDKIVKRELIPQRG